MQRGRARRAWSRAARQLGVDLEPGAEGQLRIEAALGDLIIAADGGAGATAIVAPAPSACEIALAVLRPYHSTELVDLLGLRRLQTGDRRFDETYEVHASDEGLARAWLTASAQRAMLQAIGYRYAVDSGYATARREGVERDAGRLRSAMQAVAELAAAGRALGDRWHQLATEIGGALVANPESLLGGSHIWLMRRQVPVVVDVVHAGGGGEGDRACACAMEAGDEGAPERVQSGRSDRPLPVLTCVCGQVASDASERFLISHQELERDERFSMVSDTARKRALAPVTSPELPAPYCAVSADPDRTAQRIDGAMAEQIAEIRPAAISGDAGAVSLWWPGVMLSRSRLGAAVELVTRLAARTGGRAA